MVVTLIIIMLRYAFWYVYLKRYTMYTISLAAMGFKRLEYFLSLFFI